MELNEEQMKIRAAGEEINRKSRERKKETAQDIIDDIHDPLIKQKENLNEK